MEAARPSSSATRPRSLRAADEPPETLFEAHGRGRNHVVFEPVQAARLERATRATTSGSLGEGNGSRSMMTHESASPTTSMPSQNVAGGEQHGVGRLPEPLEQIARAASRPGTRTGKASRSRTSAYTSRSRAYDVNSTNARPPRAVEALLDDRRGAPRKLGGLSDSARPAR